MIRSENVLRSLLVAVAIGVGVFPSVTHSQCPPAMTYTGEAAYDYFGMAVSGAGDVDNDGYDDLIMGSRGSGGRPGRAYVYSGKTRALLHTINGETTYDWFGFSLSGAGDVNKDGYADVIVGAWTDNRAYVFSGQTGLTLYTFTSLGVNSNFGYSVSGAGDVDNDGYADVIVGAYSSDEGGNNAGRAYVYSGQTGSPLHTFTGEAANDWFGYSVSGAGDVNNDGYADLIVGAYNNDAGGGTAGRAYVYSGQTGTLLDIITGESSGDRFGWSVSGAGDVDNDGYADLIVGAPGSDAGEIDAGRASVYSGRTGTLLHEFTGEGLGDQLGKSVSGAGDIDKDGYPDLIAGSMWNDAGGSNAGSAYVYSGQTGELLYSFTGEAAGDWFGRSVSGAGDIDNDGYADLIVGAERNDAGGTYAGRAYVYSPGKFDCDGDGLLHSWETEGYDADSNGSIDVDLPAMGADPMHKDIFVEVDWMAAGVGEAQSHTFRQAAQVLVVAMFANAPVQNPDSIPGINLHIDVGQGAPFTGGTVIPHDDDLNPFAAELAAIKTASFDANRERIFHYCVFGHKHTGGASSGRSDGIPGHDFVVTFGGWRSNPGTIYQQAGTFAHELGHNLGLRHGGGNHENWKPNLLGIMCYWYQMGGLIVNGHDGNFDYCLWDIDLDEDSLSEILGIAGPAAVDNHSVRYSCDPGTGPVDKIGHADGPIDWNCDDTIFVDPVSGDVNKDGSRTVLSGYLDWPSIDYNGGLVPAAPTPWRRTDADTIVELTEEMYLSFAILHGDVGPIEAPDGAIDLVDIVALVDYVYRNGDPPDPMFRGQINCSEDPPVINLLDVVGLIDFVFRSGMYPCSF